MFEELHCSIGQRLTVKFAQAQSADYAISWPCQDLCRRSVLAKSWDFVPVQCGCFHKETLCHVRPTRIRTHWIENKMEAVLPLTFLDWVDWGCTAARKCRYFNFIGIFIDGIFESLEMPQMCHQKILFYFSGRYQPPLVPWICH